MKTLYLDCFSGISGNMFVGMLLNGGVPFDQYQEAMGKLGIDGYSLIYEGVQKRGIQATYYNVALEDHHHYDYDDHEHAHHHHHAHRGLPEIRDIIQKADISDAVKAKSLAVFQALGEAEAKVHGVSIDEIHFHEVGAIDCILDIVGTLWCLDYLGIEQIGVSALHVGSGFVECAHGRMPVPAPATAELLVGLPSYATDVKGELVTPTGAALVKTLATHVGPRPKDFVDKKIAYGAGTKDLVIPNVLRGYLGEAPAWQH